MTRNWPASLADVTRESNGRLRWVAVLPMQTMDEAAGFVSPTIELVGDRVRFAASVSPAAAS